MSLENFLGLTHEIKIIDFLSFNLDMSYTIDELQDFTDIDTGTIRYFLPRLEYNGLIEIEGDQIKLARTEITTSLIKAVYENSFRIADYPDGVDENNFKN
jgi:DNA-binding MarR family transcriptional regulator